MSQKWNLQNASNSHIPMTQEQNSSSISNQQSGPNGSSNLSVQQPFENSQNIISTVESNLTSHHTFISENSEVCHIF